MSRHPAELDDSALMSQCRMTRGRASGPGGQHRNKVETAVILEHLPTGHRVQANERRRAEDNRRVALNRLRLKLAVAVRVARDGGPSGTWSSRVRDGKISINPKHAQFPSVLAEALDAMNDSGWQPKEAGERLGCSPSQLVKLLKLHPPAFQLVNQQRQERGLSRLR